VVTESPRFGEHRTRYWLDYVRYADTHGIHIDNYRAVWPYRDYVIRAFNANKPFDTFVREQLAGDLLPAKTFDELAATGFVRSNMTTNEGGTIPEEVYVNQTRDRVEAFGATFLGLTTGCAACHDHKFDPFTQRDHYALAAFLGNTKEKPWDLNIAEPDPVLRLKWCCERGRSCRRSMTRCARRPANGWARGSPRATGRSPWRRTDSNSACASTKARAIG
jgi:hypothetical protein